MTRGENLLGLMAVNREMLAQAGMPTRAGRIVLDMDSSESPVHGAQEGSAYNGHFASVCYHPLFLFNEHGDCVAATLRPGNVHSADDWPTCSCRKLNGSTRRARAWRSARTPRSRSRRSTTRSSIYAAGEQELGAREDIPSAGTPGLQVLGALQEFPLSGEELDHPQTDRRQGGAPPR